MFDTLTTAERYTSKAKLVKYVNKGEISRLARKIAEAKRVLEIAERDYKEEVRDGKRKYHEDIAKIEEEFKIALFKEYSIENHPKREEAFSIAWEKGHDSGYAQVEHELSTIIPLMV